MKRKYNKMIMKFARQEGVSPDYIHSQIQQAIIAGYNNPDPEVQAYWRKIAPDGKIPAPETVIEILTNEVKKK